MINNGLMYINDLFREMSPFALNYIYRGNISEDLFNRMLSFAEAGMDENEPAVLKKKVYFIMVESLQNITKHKQISNTEATDDSVFFAIQRNGTHYCITSGNIIENKNIDSLKASLNKINQMDKELLKEYYKEILSNGEFSSKGGAGLGFIEMARKSGNKLSYSFRQINDSISQFYFKVLISPPEADGTELSHSPIATNQQMLWLENIDQLIAKHKINLIYQVDFTQESLIGILSLAEGNIGSERELLLHKKVFNIIIELLQNVCKHADDPIQRNDGKQGIFLLGETNGTYSIITGNMVLNSKIESIKATLEEINNSSFDTLNRVYNRIMITDDVVEPQKVGLGFADMKLKSGNNIKYNFIEVDSTHSFFEVSVELSQHN